MSPRKSRKTPSRGALQASAAAVSVAPESADYTTGDSTSVGEGAAGTSTGDVVVPTVDVPSMLWKDLPDNHDYPAATSYLTLIADPAIVKRLVKRLRKAPIEQHKAKDLLRSSWLPLLPADDPSVARDLAKVKAGMQLSPVLLIRGDLLRGLPMVIADGYHRMCASYHLSENEDIPCRIIDRGDKEKLV